MRRFVVLAAACALSCPIFAQTAAPTAAAAPAAAPEKEKKVCRREEVTGSIMSARTCHTKSEWAAIDAATERANHMNSPLWQGPYRTNSGPGGN